MWTRKTILRLHLWAGLSLGVLFVLTAGSGTLLVYRHGIDHRLNPGLFRATPGRDLGLDRARDATGRAFPGRAVAVIDAPAMPRSGGVYVVRLAGEPEVAVHVDPGTGTVLGWRRTEDALMERLFRFHTELLAGAAGSYLVGGGGVVLLAMIGTGCLLWWPGRKKLALGFTVRRKRGAFLLSYDLHKLVGLVAAPLLALIAVTGVLLTFDTFADRLIYGVSFTPPPPGPPKSRAHSSTGETGRLPLERLRRSAEEAIPGATTVSMTLPRETGGPVRVRLKALESPHPNGRCFVHLDPQTGRIHWLRDERHFSPAEGLRSVWLYPLHIGTYGGWPSQVAHILVGLVPPVLLTTGLLVWRQHVRSRRVAAQARRNAAQRERKAPKGA